MDRDPSARQQADDSIAVFTWLMNALTGDLGTGMTQKRAALALPEVLTARAGDRLRGLFLFQQLPTNWTISLPHINTSLFTYEWSLSTK